MGIIRSEIQENIHRLKFFDLVEESMESIFASRSSLVDRDRLKKANIEIDRKILAEVVVNQPGLFKSIVKQIQSVN